MRVALRNNEIPATLNAFSQLSAVAPGALKVKVARTIAQVLRAESVFSVDAFTASEFEELQQGAIDPSLLAFLLPFVAHEGA